MAQADPIVPAKGDSANDKILWLSIVQGWAILLVVIGHVSCFTYDVPGELFPLSDAVTRFCYAFHMPLFMFVSGGLLYYSRIAKGWGTRALYVDKFKRLALPYIFFTLFALLLKGFLGSYTKRGGVEISIGAFLDALFDPAHGPIAEMWFVATLLWFMAMYPLLRAALRNQYLEMGLLGATLLPFVFGNPWEFGPWFNLGGVPGYMFYFVGGMLFFKYSLYRFAESKGPWVPLGLTVLFAASVYALAVPRVVAASAGILMSVAWGVWLHGRMPGLFGWFRGYSFQIFLIGIFPQMFLELFVWKRMPHEWLQLPYYIASCVAAIAISVVVSRLVGRVPSRLVRRLFGLK